MRNNGYEENRRKYSNGHIKYGNISNNNNDDDESEELSYFEK